MIKNLKILFIVNYSLLTINCYAQHNSQYMPQYNLWVPGCNSHSCNKIPQRSPRSSVDSVFNWQYVITPTYLIADIFFIDSLYGWYTDGSGYVSRSTDSGFNWDTTALFPGGGAVVTGVYFINDNTGWAVGQVNLIRKTTNGGVNWITQDWPSYPNNYYESVHFFNWNRGIITGNYGDPFYTFGYIIGTTNGGVNWFQKYISTDSSYSETTIFRQFWINEDTGWFAGYNILLKTTDGGNTFTNFYSHVPPTQNGYNGFLDLCFTNEETGWICGGNLDSRNIYKTTSAGANWTFQDNPVAHCYYPQIDGIIFISQDTGWASSYAGLIIVTTNGGTSWVVDDTTYHETDHFTKYQSSKVWLAGEPELIYYNCLSKPVGIINHDWSVPESFKLYQNYPNPFNPKTRIKFSLPSPSVGGQDPTHRGSQAVQLIVYDVLGCEVAKLVNEQLRPGTYVVEFDGSNYPSGVYFYELRSGTFVESKKLVLLK